MRTARPAKAEDVRFPGIHAHLRGHENEWSIARAIVATAADRGIAVQAAQVFEVTPGRGACAAVDGRRFAVGGPNLLAAEGVSPSVEFERFAGEAATHAQSIVYLIERNRVLAAFAVADAVRVESADAVRQLQQSGIDVVMMTGDARSIADAVAHALGIDTVLAQVLPQDKAANIERLQQQGRRVAMSATA